MYRRLREGLDNHSLQSYPLSVLLLLCSSFDVNESLIQVDAASDGFQSTTENVNYRIVKLVDAPIFFLNRN
jgi:hypothetical protein